MLAIAKAESGINANAKNPSSTASGVMQFLDSTFKNYCVKKYGMADEKDNPFIQINCAVEMLKEKDGWFHWKSSYAVWGKTYPIAPSGA